MQVHKTMTFRVGAKVYRPILLSGHPDPYLVQTRGKLVPLREVLASLDKGKARAIRKKLRNAGFTGHASIQA